MNMPSFASLNHCIRDFQAVESSAAFWAMSGKDMPANSAATIIFFINDKMRNVK